jgi:hypothetical protein
MKKASKKKAPKAKVKKPTKAPSKKPKTKTVQKKKAAPVKKTKKAPVKKAVKAPAKKTKKAPAKKPAPKKAAPASKGGAKSNFLKVIEDSLALIQKIKGKGDNIQKNINHEQKKMFATDDPTEKLLHFFQIEGLKIETFTKVQADFEALSVLLNKAYAFANQVGGVVKDDFLNICQDLSKGINLDLMQSDFEKLKKDLKRG